MRYTYAYGYKSQHDAEAALEQSYAAGEISTGEKARIYRYSCPGGHRWAIDLES